MRSKEVYSSKNVVSLALIFFVLFWLLYSIGSFLHESQKISQEIEKIRQANIAIAEQIEKKKEEIAYLKTPQRIEKEAKIQMNKRAEGEKVLVLVLEEPLNAFVPERKKNQKRIEKASNWEKWEWVFLGKS